MATRFALFVALLSIAVPFHLTARPESKRRPPETTTSRIAAGASKTSKPGAPAPVFQSSSVTALKQAIGARVSSLASVGDAYVSQNEDGSQWSIGNDAIKLTVGFDRRQNLQVAELLNQRTGRGWDLEPAPDTIVTIGGHQLSLGSHDAGFAFEEAKASLTDAGVRLAFTFDLPRERARVTRYYACYPSAPVIETWTVFSTDGAGTITLSDLNSWQLTIGAGAVHWLTGLEASDDDGGAFTLRRRELGPGERLDLEAQGRSSQFVVPWFAVDSGDSEFFGGIMWSGSWHLSIERRDNRLRIGAGLAGVSTGVQQGTLLEAPHGFFGVAPGTAADVPAALRSFIVLGVRGGRPFDPLVIYNTWFPYGTRINESSMRDEMDRAARAGTELFTLDAGWYPGAGAQGIYDFTSGLGSWRADPERFPSGLGALSDYAHSLDMRFGIWVEPERVALSTVGQTGLAQERWLATIDGHYEPGVPQSESVAAQICLADPGARQWVLDRVVQLIDTVHADYLKWDNNFWINCNRPGHTHGASDGNFAHVRGLYALLGALRDRYPDLLINNVSGGGRRLDLGMLRFTDVAWMDDRSAPSAHVRHNLEGLSAIFPPGYLLSYVMSGEAEPIHGGSDLPLYVRSRMPGVLGESFRGAELNEAEEEQIRREVATYKDLREALREASAVLLTDQATPGGPAWDVVEEVSATATDVVIFAFQTDAGASRTVVRPRGLRAGATYEIRSIDRGVLGSATGTSLMNDGLEISASPTSAAQVLRLVIQSDQLRTGLRP